MAFTPDVYVDSTAGGLNDGTSWTNAYTSIASAGTNAAAGDVVGVSKNHSESVASITWSNGTIDNPVKVMSLDPADDSYVSRNQNGDTDGASFTGTTFKMIGHVRTYGCHFDYSGDIVLVDDTDHSSVHYIDCLIQAGDDLFWAACLAPWVLLRDCTIEFLNRGIFLGADGATVELYNCDVQEGSAPGTLVDASFPIEYGSKFILKNCDLTDFSTIIGDDQGYCTVHIDQCQMRASYDLHSGTPANGTKILVERSSSSTGLSVPVLGLQELATLQGTVKATTAKYRTGGADDGEQANAYSWEMASNANAGEVFSCLESPWITRWVDGGVSITCTIYIGSENITLQDDEVWVELITPDETATSTTLADFRTSKLGEPATTPVNGQMVGTPQDTPANLTADGASTWNGFTTASEQKVDFTFTPDIAGPVKMRVCLAKASTTIYVDPLIEVA